MHHAFSLLAEPIQRVLWDMRWEKLRPIQEQAIRIVLETKQDLLISARTAAGKTEAAFLPILSQILATNLPSIQALYVGPLKALINDQFQRMEDLCLHAKIPVHRWHGDVSQSRKKALLKEPSGVLLITPESLESLFINQSAALQPLFRHLEYVVIDELHSFQGTERGTHLRSLLFRLERVVSQKLRYAGLSATLGDPRRGAEWLRPDDPNRVALLKDTGSQKAIRFRICAFRRPILKRNGRGERLGIVGNHEEVDKQGESEPPHGMVEEIYESFHRDKNLLFVNARSGVEWFADLLNTRAARDGRRGQFLVHHGSLSKEVREHTEQLMQGKQPFSTLCTATLELGIDIGNVVSIGQIGVPFSVNSLVQRLGRSGRKDDQPQSMRLYVIEDDLPQDAPLWRRVRPELLQAIALTELMLEKWVEPAAESKGDFSTLIQQILSVLAETGGLKADSLFEQLSKHGAFRHVSQRMFVDVLRGLGQHDLIQQMPEGDLILGLQGQQIVESYEFYSAFATSPEYRVTYQGRSLGALSTFRLPNVGDHLLLAGGRWQVASLDHQRKEVTVNRAHGRKLPKFDGEFGVIHPRVRQMMQQILLGQKEFKYLNSNATELLNEARRTAQEANLATSSLLPLSESKTLWFTWTGTAVQATLPLLAAQSGIECADHEIALELAAALPAVRDSFMKFVAEPPTSVSLAALASRRDRRKYDAFLSDDLSTKSFASDIVDIPGAISVIDGIVADRIARKAQTG